MTTLIPKYDLNSTGSVNRPFNQKLAEIISVKDFGAVGDGVTDDTTAVQAAINYSMNNGKSLYVPSGTYLVDTLTCSSGKKLTIYGEFANTTLKKKTSDGMDLFVVSNSTTTTYTDGFFALNITFRGVSGDTASSFKAYDLVRSKFENCIFENSLKGVSSLGGISNTFVDCIFQNNAKGISFDKYISSAGGGYPNNNDIQSCIIVDNSLIGIEFLNGRNLYINNCDIEGNGTTGDVNSTGVVVSDVNSESSGAGPAIGLSMANCWLEANAGNSSLQLNSGINTVATSYFVANPNATYDINIVNGNYHLTEVAFGANKIINLKEETTVNLGNSMTNCYDALVGAFSIDTTKTTVIGAFNSGTGILANTIQLRGGSVATVINKTNPKTLTGTDTTNASGIITVVFSTPFITAPIVTANILNNAPSEINSLQLYSVTTTGFSAIATKYISSVTALTSTQISWSATGATD